MKGYFKLRVRGQKLFHEFETKKYIHDHGILKFFSMKDFHFIFDNKDMAVRNHFLFL